MEDLTESQLEFIKKHMERWSSKTTFEMRSYMTKIMISDIPSKNNFFIDWLRKVGKMTPWVLKEKKVLIDIFLYYFVGIIFGFSHHDTLETLHGEAVYEICEDRILKFSVLCVVSDKLLDDYGEEYQIIVSSQMKRLIKSLILKREIDVDGIDPKVFEIYLILKGIINDVPDSMGAMIRAFNHEVDSSKQKNIFSSYNDIMDIETKKGSSTYELLGVILNNGKTLDVPVELGICLQFFDDLTDIYVDRDDNIKTFPLLEIEKKNCVDLVILKIIECLDKLDSKYWVFNVCMSSNLAMYAMQNQYVSSTLTEIFKPYVFSNISSKINEDYPIIQNMIQRCFENNLIYI